MPQVINEVGDKLSVPVNVIDDTGAHAAVTDAFTGTTVHNEAGTDLALSDPTVVTLGTGIYRLEWAGVTAHMLDGAKLNILVNGSTAAGAWSAYLVEVYVRAVERGTDGVDTSGLSTFDHTADEVITDAASRDASKADVSGLSTFDPATDEVITDAASRDASKADTASLATQSELDKVIKSGEPAIYSSDLGFKSVTATRE